MYGSRNVNVYKMKDNNNISELSAFSFVPKLSSERSTTTNIIGRFQYLKNLEHPNLCQYINITKNRKDRIFIVSEYFENSLEEHLKQWSNITNITRLKRLTYQILSALVYLNENGIVNRNLSLNNILLDNENNVKLDNWGFYYFTDKGNVPFPIGNPEFYAPEIIQTGCCNLKADTWALGVILIYIYLGYLPFNINNVNYLEDLFEAIISLKKIKNEEKHYLVGDEEKCSSLKTFFKDQLQDDEELKLYKDFILTCLEPDVELRPTPSELLCHDFIKEFNINTNEMEHLTTKFYKSYSLFSESINNNIYDINNQDQVENNINDNVNTYLDEKKINIIRYEDSLINDIGKSELELERLQPKVIFYLWRLAGGDLEYEFIKQELISLPSIYRVRNASRIYYSLNEDNSGIVISDKNSLQQIADPENLYQDKKLILSLDSLISQFDEYKKSNNNSNNNNNDNDFLISLLKNDTNYFLSKNGISQEKDISLLDFVNNNEFVDFWNSSKSVNKINDNNSNLNENIDENDKVNNINKDKNDDHYEEINKILDEDETNNNINKDDVQKTILELYYNSSVLDKDVIFQYGRIKLFDRLLHQLPASWNEFIQEAKIHIPSFLRGKIWSAALGVTGDSKTVYNSLCEKCNIRSYDNTDTSMIDLERQLEADIPRCHQYNDLLSSDIGHDKLKKVIKCWNMAERGNLVYWQGLDSVCAPFVALNFNDEDIAFSCLLNFIRKYMYGVFKIDNSFYIQSYLEAMNHIISYHDPELGSFLNKIGLSPDIYAIPWFMTMFTHVFPLDKIYTIWDKILTGKPFLPIFIGSAIVIQLRSEILSGDFDESVLLLSELSAINIDKCLEKAEIYLRITPKSFIPKFLHMINVDNNPLTNNKNVIDNIFKDSLPNDIAIVEDLNTLHLDELAPRISIEDFEKIYSKSLILDVRNESVLTTLEDNGYVVISPGGSFLQGHIKNSISLPYYEKEILPTSLINYIKIIFEGYTYLIVVGEEERATKLAAQLINEHIPRVAYLNENDVKKETFDSWHEHKYIWCCKKPEVEKFYIDENQDDSKSLDITRNVSPISTRSFNSERPYENKQTFIIYKCY
ncbi:hypothetical protein BCR32DRAFT_295840 [Anaeromyces robustus]|uniref:TBC-domain-containing protein n=1 Tax=Anaeromyces robustus TaxID=1754192 RepID=A0A1Y1WUK8_9FUNG|nr:hypothetical protein BCR32DRAFT_295840 [Anaeromyces robustus]|eukprot:ORX77085.1 hypothetical protein BCR32DRAFT_295840 [Anaeromyces robustus]